MTGRLMSAMRPIRMSPRFHATSNFSSAPQNTRAAAARRKTVSIQCLISILLSRKRKFTSA